MIILVQQQQLLWVAGEGPTIEWSCLPRKIVREKRPSFRGQSGRLYRTKRCRMSRKVGMGEVPFHHRVMSDDIVDIQDPRYYMSRRHFSNLYLGLHGPGWIYVLKIPLGGQWRL